MRLRLASQRTAIWASAEEWDPAYWIQTGGLRNPEADRQAEEDPAVLVARDQIRKDGGQLIVENVTKAVDAWRAKTLKPDEPM